jgi:hypothetical protein
LALEDLVVGIIDDGSPSMKVTRSSRPHTVVASSSRPHTLVASSSRPHALVASSSRPHTLVVGIIDDGSPSVQVTSSSSLRHHKLD